MGCHNQLFDMGSGELRASTLSTEPPPNSWGFNLLHIFRYKEYRVFFLYILYMWSKYWEGQSWKLFPPSFLPSVPSFPPSLLETEPRAWYILGKCLPLNYIPSPVLINEGGLKLFDGILLNFIFMHMSVLSAGIQVHLCVKCPWKPEVLNSLELEL